eukprot:symbB.v1.2.026819.t1/scaffold2709.1/size72633/2
MRWRFQFQFDTRCSKRATRLVDQTSWRFDPDRLKSFFLVARACSCLAQLRWVNLGAWLLASGYELKDSNDRSLSCKAEGSEDWPSAHRQLIRLLDGQVGANVLAEELDRVASSFTGRLGTGNVDLHSDCIPGRFSLELLMLLTHPGPFDGVWNEGGLLDLKWKILRWPTLVRTGWPIFRLLRLLQKQAQAQAEAEALPGYVRHRKAHEAILGASVSFLMNLSGCQLSAAAACLAGAWVRFPVYDEETEDLLRLAEQFVQNTSLARILVTDHGLLDMLDDVAGSYQAFLIDSGALYVDLREQDKEEGVHSECSALQEQTPLGRCNPFAALGPALSPWKKRGIAQEDTIRALQATLQPSRKEPFVPHALLFRLVEDTDARGGELRLLAAQEVAKEFGPLVDCLAKIFLQSLAAILFAGMPRLEFVVSLWEKPIMWRSGAWMNQFGRREDVPPPLFSGNATWDIPLPQLCQQYRKPCSKVQLLSEEEEQCYVFRLLSGYSELLRYVPPGHALEEQAMTVDDLSMAAGVRVVKSWPLPADAEMEEFMSWCGKLIDELAG